MLTQAFLFFLRRYQNRNAYLGMNEWQRQDEDVRQLTLMRQSSQSVNIGVQPESASIDGRPMLSSAGKEGDLEWRTSSGAVDWASEGTQRTTALEIRPENSLVQSSSLIEGSEEELVHSLYDVDLEFGNSPDQKAGAGVAGSGAHGVQGTTSSGIESYPAPAPPDHVDAADQAQSFSFNADEEARLSRRKVFRVGGLGAEDSDSDSSSLAAALEKAGMKLDKVTSGDAGGQRENDIDLDAASEISSNMSTARAGAVEPVSILKVGRSESVLREGTPKVDADENRGVDAKNEGSEQSRQLERTSSFAFHGKDRADIRRTRMVHWEGEDGQNSARGDDDLESIATINTAGTHEGGSAPTHPNGKEFPPVLTQTEIRAMNPVVLPGSHKAPVVPATSALIEDRKILSMNLDLPPSMDVHETYTQTKLPEEKRVQLLLPLNRHSRKAVKKHRFEKKRKEALEQLRKDVAKRQHERYGGTLDFHLNGKPLNPYEEVIVTSNRDFRPHRQLDFKELNPFYKLNQHEVTCRLLLGCVDKPKLTNMKVRLATTSLAQLS